MKIKFGMMMTDGRGKLGGQVASKNRAGAYVRTKSIPSNPQSTPQSQVRSTFASISSLWRGLSDANRASWNEAVNNWTRTDVFGDLKTPSGFNLFMRLCTPLKNAFDDVIIQLYAPSPVELPALHTVSATVNSLAGTFSLATSVSNDVDLSLYVYNVYATAPQSAGKSYVKNQYRLLGWVEADASTRDIMDMYVAKFGNIPEGANVAVRVQSLARATGQLGVPFDVKADFFFSPVTIASLTVTPDSGDNPYVVDMTLAGAPDLVSIGGRAEVARTTSTGVCPVSGFAISPIFSNDLTNNMTYTETTTVPNNQCRGIQVTIYDADDNVLDRKQVNVSNIV